MPSVPVPVVTLAILLLLLAKVYLSRVSRHPGALWFLAGCAVVVLMSALRWSFDLPLLRQMQTLAAICLPPLTWRCFASLTDTPLRWRHIITIAPPAAALILHLFLPAVTDTVLILLYIGYGGALLRTAQRGEDRFVLSRLSDAPVTSRLAFIAGGFLCFSGLADMAIAVDFSLYRGEHAALLVVISQAILLPFLCLGILLPPRNAAPQAMPKAPATATISAIAIEEAQRCAQLEALITDQALYLNPDLTLNALARKTATPARHISRAVNATRGCNVSQWINGFRIAHAQRLLRQTSSPVTAVMLDSGFNTKSNFNREFMRITGMSPGEYRRAAPDNEVPDSGMRESPPPAADGSLPG